MTEDLSEFDEFFQANGPVQILNQTAEHSEVRQHTPALNQRKPSYVFKNERPIHRAIFEYSAQGYTDVEIANILGCTPVMVGYTRKQPQYQQMLADAIKQKVNEDHRVVEVIRTNVVKAVQFLADTVSDAAARKLDRIAAAESLLNRRYGKPNQPINRGTDVDLNSLSDAELANMLPETQATATS